MQKASLLRPKGTKTLGDEVICFLGIQRKDDMFETTLKKDQTFGQCLRVHMQLVDSENMRRTIKNVAQAPKSFLLNTSPPTMNPCRPLQGSKGKFCYYHIKGIIF